MDLTPHRCLAQNTSLSKKEVLVWCPQVLVHCRAYPHPNWREVTQAIYPRCPQGPWQKLRPLLERHTGELGDTCSQLMEPSLLQQGQGAHRQYTYLVLSTKESPQRKEDCVIFIGCISTIVPQNTQLKCSKTDSQRRI